MSSSCGFPDFVNGIDNLRRLGARESSAAIVIQVRLVGCSPGAVKVGRKRKLGFERHFHETFTRLLK